MPRWTASTGSLTVAAGAIGSSQLFSGGDAGLSSTVEGECTLERVVGRLSVIPSTNTASAVGIGLLKSSVALAPVFGGFEDPLVAQQLIERDWLRVLNCDLNANSLAMAVVKTFELDMRVKRRLKEDEGFVLTVSNAAGGGSVTVTIDIRILIVIHA